MSLGLEVGKGFVAKVVQAALGFAGTVIFARVLGPASFGGFYLLLSLTQLPTQLVMGVSKAVQKRYAEAGAPRRELLGILFGSIGLALIAAAAGAFIFRDFLVSYTGLASAPWLFVLLFTAVANFPMYQNLLPSIGRLSAQTWIDTLRSFVTFPLQLLFVLAGYGAAGMAYGLSLGTFLLVPVTHYYLQTLPAVPTRATIRSVWSFARYSAPSNIFGTAYDRFDVLLLGFLATPAVAGNYEIAYKLTVPATFIAGLSGSGLMATLSDLDSRGEAFQTEISNTLAFSSLFAVPLFFGALAISRVTVVTIYSSEYRAAATLLIGIALYRLINTQANVLTDIVSGLDMPELQLRASAVTLAVNIPLGVFLYTQIGAVGVVVATVLAEFLRYLIMLWYVKQQTQARLVPRALLEQLAVGAVMALAVESTQQFITVQSWIDFGLLIGVGGLVYFGLLVVVSSHFRVTVEGVWQDLRSELR